MTESTRNMLTENLNNVAELLDALWQAYVGDGQYEDQDAGDYLNELPLEIVWEKGEPFAVVLGTGGPHIEIRGGTRHDGEGYALHGYWSGEHVVLRGRRGVSSVGEHFRDWAEEAL